MKTKHLNLSLHPVSASSIVYSSSMNCTANCTFSFISWRNPPKNICFVKFSPQAHSSFLTITQYSCSFFEWVRGNKSFRTSKQQRLGARVSGSTCQRERLCWPASRTRTVVTCLITWAGRREGWRNTYSPSGTFLGVWICGLRKCTCFT